MVIKAYDSRTKTTVAIKKITKIYDKVGLAKRAYRELNILRLVQGETRSMTPSEYYHSVQYS